jgi:MotA/TolQ/ExbB proton channel family
MEVAPSPALSWVKRATHNANQGAAINQFKDSVHKGMFSFAARLGVHANFGRDPALEWSLFAAVILFAAVLLWKAGAWFALNNADSTGITQVTVLLFFGATAWCGHRAFLLSAQMAAGSEAAHSWSGRYRAGSAHADAPTLAALEAQLLDAANGPHESAWWINGVLLKLGLLGTVVGFMIMAFQVAGLDAFDVEQAQKLLQRMTGGMAIALLTTLVGLVGNLLLGLQLLLLDRAADRLVGAALLAAHQPRTRV